MVGQFYKGITIGSEEPVNYVGVHPLVWHDHPEHPDLGFAELELEDIKTLLNSLEDDERHELLGSYCHGCGSKDKTCQCWNDD